MGEGGFAGDGKGTKQRATRDQLKLAKWHEMESSRGVFIRAVVDVYKDSALVTASECQAGAFIHAALPYQFGHLCLRSWLHCSFSYGEAWCLRG